ncbi:MAG: DUF2612 domain-containing protein [Steroidobacteraceae bacterium]
MYNVESTIGSQYANSPSIDALIASMNAWIDPTVNFQQFYNLVWNISTAQGFGLDIWGSIIGVSRNLQIPASVTYFGFQGGAGLPFNNAPFYAGHSATQTYTLSDTEYLPLLLAKAYANIVETTIPALNQMLQMIYGEYGTAYVIDNGSMSMTFYFNFVLTPVQYAIVATSGVIPHPTGVLVDITTAADVPLLAENGNTLLTENGIELLVN